MPNTRSSLAPALALLALSLACSEDDAPAMDSGAPDQGARPDLVVQPLPDLGKLTLVVNLGDSIAAGYGMPTGEAFMELLMQNDDAAHPAFKGKDLKSKYPGIKLSDRSKGSSTSSDLPGQAARAATNPAGDTLVLISIGINDLLFNYSALLDAKEALKIAASAQANILEALKRFSDKKMYGGKVSVLLYSIFEVTDGAGFLPKDAPGNQYCGVIKLLGPQVSKKVTSSFVLYNQEMAKFIRTQGLLMGDLYAAFLGHGFSYKDKSATYYNAADPTLWFLSDCVHPNSRGHAGIRAETWRVLFGN